MINSKVLLRNAVFSNCIAKISAQWFVYLLSIYVFIYQRKD